MFITNYHVYRGIYEAATDYPYHHALMIACAPYNSGKQQNMSSQDYCFFDDQYNISDLKACYEYVGLIKYEGEVKETYMDMTAIELDLTDVYKDSNTPKNIKDKLDYINSQAKVGENVVTICDDVNKGDKVYIAGYP
ncbi:MAG: hypothetical protein K2M43_02885 [Mycoplasmoidaceae bacterium]|nr:hypothetical protein [Mycoplasmoidaceae bacterium]